MIVSQPNEFLQQLERRQFMSAGPVCAPAVMLIEPVDFRVCDESAMDNHYMDRAATPNPERARQQSHKLAELIRQHGLEVIVFPGDPETPDAIFPNNVFATTPENLIIGRMLHPARKKEAERQDIRQYFRTRGYRTVDLSQLDCVAELTGTLIIDHARHIGFCGVSGRADQAGVRAMHAAFGLNMTFSFELKPQEYHTNVVMMILAGRACVVYPEAFVDPLVPLAIQQAFAGRTLVLDEVEKNAFAGNCIALTEKDLFMSQTGLDALRPASLQRLESWGFKLHATPLDEIEKAGGSLRCMLAEVFRHAESELAQSGHSYSGAIHPIALE